MSTNAPDQPVLTIRGGRVIDPANGVDRVADLRLVAGRVQSLDDHRTTEPNGPWYDARGLIVCPGLMDPHVHLREPGQEDKETIATGAASAVAGGFTSVCCMPNTVPALDDDASMRLVYEKAQEAGQAHVFPVGAISRGREGKELAEMMLMARAGAVGFTDDGAGVADSGLMVKAMQYAAPTGLVLMQHCEDPRVGGGAMNAGTLATKLGLPGWPNLAEDLMIARDCMIARSQRYATRWHAQHMSTAGGVELLRESRERYRRDLKVGRAMAWPQGRLPVTGEASPHHLLLTEDACAGYDTRAKMNPPLRTRSDVDALTEGVRDGTITILATDHAPHTLQDKQQEFARAAYGIVGLECALALYVEALIEPGVVDWPKLIGMMTAEPAALVGLQDRKGQLGQGADADVTIIDPEVAWTIDTEAFKSKGRNCPFDGREVKGRAIEVVVEGTPLFSLEDDRHHAGWAVAPRRMSSPRPAS